MRGFRPFLRPAADTRRKLLVAREKKPLVPRVVTALLETKFLKHKPEKTADIARRHPRRRGGGVLPYTNKPYRYVPPQREGFLRRFGMKTGTDFVHFGLEWGMVFNGTTGMYQRIYCFNSK